MSTYPIYSRNMDCPSLSVLIGCPQHLVDQLKADDQVFNSAVTEKGGERLALSFSKALDRCHSPDLPLYFSRQLRPDSPSSIEGSLLQRYARLLSADLSEVIAFAVIAGPGCSVGCHFDVDYRDIDIVQLLGTKRVWTAPPSTIFGSEPFFNHTAERLSSFVDPDKSQIVHAVIDPGQSTTIPRFFWHQVEHLVPSVSLILRRTRPTALEFASQFLHSDVNLQRLFHFLFDCDPPHPSSKQVIESLHAIALRDRTAEDKFRMVVDATALWLREYSIEQGICPDRAYEWLAHPDSQKHIIAIYGALSTVTLRLKSAYSR